MTHQGVAAYEPTQANYVISDIAIIPVPQHVYTAVLTRCVSVKNEPYSLLFNCANFISYAMGIKWKHTPDRLYKYLTKIEKDGIMYRLCN